MKRIFQVSLFVLSMLAAVSCSKEYEEKYDSIYRTDAEGNEVPRMFTWYDIASSTGTLPIVIYYSGSWTVDFAEEPGWAYLDRKSGTGVSYIHVGYLQNNTGNNRSLLLKLSCDNGETLDITINQATV